MKSWASPSRSSTKEILLVRFSTFRSLVKANLWTLIGYKFSFKYYLVVKNAEKGGYAVGAFNVYNLEGIEAVVAAAEAEKSPAILQVRNFNMLIFMKSFFERNGRSSDFPLKRLELT